MKFSQKQKESLKKLQQALTNQKEKFSRITLGLMQQKSASDYLMLLLQTFDMKGSLSLIRYLLGADEAIVEEAGLLNTRQVLTAELQAKKNTTTGAFLEITRKIKEASEKIEQILSLSEDADNTIINLELMCSLQECSKRIEFLDSSIKRISEGLYSVNKRLQKSAPSQFQDQAYVDTTRPQPSLVCKQTQDELILIKETLFKEHVFGDFEALVARTIGITIGDKNKPHYEFKDHVLDERFDKLIDQMTENFANILAINSHVKSSLISKWLSEKNKEFLETIAQLANEQRQASLDLVEKRSQDIANNVASNPLDILPLFATYKNIFESIETFIQYQHEILAQLNLQKSKKPEHSHQLQETVVAPVEESENHEVQIAAIIARNEEKVLALMRRREQIALQRQKNAQAKQQRQIAAAQSAKENIAKPPVEQKPVLFSCDLQRLKQKQLWPLRLCFDSQHVLKKSELEDVLTILGAQEVGKRGTHIRYKAKTVTFGLADKPEICGDNLDRLLDAIREIIEPEALSKILAGIDLQQDADENAPKPANRLVS